MDDININGVGGGGGGAVNCVRIVPGGPQPSPQQPYKRYSLQRGSTAPTEVAPPKAPSNPIYASTTTNGDGTVVIRRPNSAKGQPASTASSAVVDDEDPYGRCTNMKLTSFVDGNNTGGNIGNGTTTQRDPRIIDLTLRSSPNSSQNGLNQHYPQQQPQPNFNTLPAQVSYAFGDMSSSTGF